MSRSYKWSKRYDRFIEWIRLITFYEIAVGMTATLKHLLRYRPITLQYPHEKRLLSDNHRGMLALLRYDDGTDKYIGCDLCEAACPSRGVAVVRSPRGAGETVCARLYDGHDPLFILRALCASLPCGCFGDDQRIRMVRL